jgi:hypothetical protein
MLIVIQLNVVRKSWSFSMMEMTSAQLIGSHQSPSPYHTSLHNSRREVQISPPYKSANAFAMALP